MKTAKEIAAHFGVHYKSVLRHISEGLIPVQKVPRTSFCRDVVYWITEEEFAKLGRTKVEFLSIMKGRRNES